MIEKYNFQPVAKESNQILFGNRGRIVKIKLEFNTEDLQTDLPIKPAEKAMFYSMDKNKIFCILTSASKEAAKSGL
jgi:hypothetical protein